MASDAGDHSDGQSDADLGTGYVEQCEFTLRFDLRCKFPENYEGDADGFEWVKTFPAIAREIVHSAAAIIRRNPGWNVRPANRGRPVDEEVTLLVTRDPEG
jgi:hypothetical protein